MLTVKFDVHFENFRLFTFRGRSGSNQARAPAAQESPRPARQGRRRLADREPRELTEENIGWVHAKWHDQRKWYDTQPVRLFVPKYFFIHFRSRYARRPRTLPQASVARDIQNEAGSTSDSHDESSMNALTRVLENSRIELMRNQHARLEERLVPFQTKYMANKESARY